MAEFKLSRLRFTWLGEWATGTTYNRDAIVLHEGKTYVCLVPHTAGNFYNALNATPVAYWTLQADGKSWAGEWEASTAYSLGNIVHFGGATYYCITPHTSSTAFVTNEADWGFVAISDNWHQVWSISTNYGIGDVVRYGGKLYRCIDNHVSVATALLGLEANTASWAEYRDGVEYRGVWTSNTAYKINELVKLGADIWKCISTHPATVGFNSNSNFVLYMPGERYASTWAQGVTYFLDDVVSYGGYEYQCIINNTVGIIPSLDSLNWDLISTGFKTEGNWLSGQTYKAGSVVRRGGNTFVATVNTSNTDPLLNQVEATYNPTGSSGTTVKLTGIYIANIAVGQILIGPGFNKGQTVVKIEDGGETITINEPPDSTPSGTIRLIGVNKTSWELLTPGVRWLGFWSVSTLYVPGDLVLWQNATYRCIQAHSSLATNSPIYDTVNTYWVTYLLHARNNASNTVGDITTYNINQYTAIAIGPEEYAFRAIDNFPSWRYVNRLSNVYYVSEDGTDDTAHGITLDRPWKSIRYACSTLLAGTINQQSAYLLRSNKEFVIQEMYQWMLAQVAQENAPFDSSSTFDQTKTLRDARFVIDAVLYDITRGGNSQTVAATLAYFSSSTAFFNQSVADEMPYFIAGLTYLTELVGLVLTNTAPTFNYQLINSAPVTVSQVINTNYTAESGSITLADESETTFTNAGNGAYTINARNNPIINLVRGNTYEFTLNVVGSHPTWIQTQGGAYNAAYVYTDGVLGNGANNGATLTFTVPYDAPDTLYYQCQLHARMFGQINIYDVTAPIIEVAPAITTVNSLLGVLTTALTNTSTAAVPLANSNLTATIFVKTGTYKETLPITIPDNVAINGDELRGVTIRPLTTYTSVTTSSLANKFIVASTAELTANMPVQFIGTAFGSVTAGTTYYVVGSSITPTAFSVSTIAGGVATPLANTLGSMSIYAGDCLKNMFYMRNGSGLRNVTLSGLLGTLTAENQFQTRRPTGGAYVSLDPGTGPNDTSAWIYRRSPYAQNVSLFGSGCTGLKVDGTLHNGGNRSIVANDFTTILSDGIGAWVTGNEAKSELVSVFSYYAYAGYFAEAGGRIRSANGNSSYGTYGVIAEGYNNNEAPLTGNVLNRSSQVQATIQSSLGLNAQLLKLQYANAGRGYNIPTTNLLSYSNEFLNGAWSTDNEIGYQQNIVAPTTYSEAWTLTSTSTIAEASYIQQAITVTPSGATYTGLAGTNLIGSGIDATFNVTVTGQSTYAVTVNATGSGYVVGNQIKILGSALGGVDVTNDLLITVATLGAFASISTVTRTGTVPLGSSRPYLVSFHLKKGTASTADIYTTFSGSSAVSNKLNFNFNTGVATPSIATPLAGTLAGSLPTSYGAIPLSNGWYRVWFTTWDKIGLNNSLTVRLYPTGYATRTAGLNSYVYGSQIQTAVSTIALSFYLETTTNKYTSYANFQITGSGAGAVVHSDELRSKAVFETRVVEGGSGYLTSSNNSQGGTNTYVILAASDNNISSNYIGMRIFINSGTGSGQYGYISTYNSSTKIAKVLKESFDILTITATSSSGNTLTVGAGDYNQLYVNQPVQFIPTYYNLTVTNSSRSTTIVTSTVGGLTNKLVATTTANLQLYMPVVFSGTTFGSITAGFTYYVASIDANGTDFQVSTTQYGSVWTISTGLGTMALSFPTNTGYLTGSTTNMRVNMPITFSGSVFGGIRTATTYFVNSVYDATTFSISSSLITVSASSTTVSTNVIAVASTSSLTAFNPIVFSGTTFGNIVAGTTYFINKIPAGGTTFTIASSLVTRTATSTVGDSDLIYVTSTTGFVANAPIRFSGTSFGGILAETTYFILAINDGVSFTISTTVGGGSVNISNGKGSMVVRTATADFALVSATGTMTGATTTPKILGTSASGLMTATISTSVFGGVSADTTYYILSKGVGNFNITSTSGGTAPVDLSSTTGSMSLAAIGWDHIIPGNLIESALDSSSLYYIEPRIQFSDPQFSQVSTTLYSQSPNTYTAVTYGDGYFIAIASSSGLAARSTNGTTWTALAMPASDQTWNSIAYGNGYWVTVSGGTSQYAYYSSANGEGWRRSTLPTANDWIHVAYGNGIFVALAPSGLSGAVAASTNNGATWTSGIMPFGAPASWTNIVYGAGKFVAIASGSAQAAYSTNGTLWTACNILGGTQWTDIAYGNGRFVAITTNTAKSAYSFDGITWYLSDLEILGTDIVYGQGVFLVVCNGQSTGYTSEDGINWKSRTITADNYNGVAFGYNASADYAGIFVTVSGANTGSVISAGTRTKGRPVVTSNVIVSINEWEAGSNYASAPSVTFTDPNNTNDAVVTPRLGSGALGNPSIINKGTGYSLNSTYINITGNGYSDAYQVGYTLIANNLLRIPAPGDNLTIAGVGQTFKVTNATVMFGTTAPNIEANIQVSPNITADISPAEGTAISIRQQYSQVRLTGHDLLNIGYGNFEESNYPSVPTSTELRPQNQAVEVDFGRVFYTTGDQDGNFKVGNLFGVEQSTGIVTLSATQFGLTGLETLSLGGIAVGGSSVIIRQFGTDSTLAANSDNIIPTQKAIKTYVSSRLSQGGSNTFTGNLIAGNISVGNPNFISNLVPPGIAGSSIQMPNKVVVSGASASWAGGGAAYFMFAGTWARRGNVKPGR